MFNGGSWFVNYVYCPVSSTDPFGNRYYAFIYDTSTLNATENGCNYYSYNDFTFSDDVWTVRYTTALDITGSNSDSVCGSSSGDDDPDDDGRFGDCDYLKCLQTEKFDNDDFNTYWLPVGCLNSEGYYGNTINNEIHYLFCRTSSEEGAARYLTNDLGTTDEALNNVDIVYYCDGNDDLEDCGKRKWEAYDSSSAHYEEDQKKKKKTKSSQ